MPWPGTLPAKAIPSRGCLKSFLSKNLSSGNPPARTALSVPRAGATPLDDCPVCLPWHRPPWANWQLASRGACGSALMGMGLMGMGVAVVVGKFRHRRRHRWAGSLLVLVAN